MRSKSYDTSCRAQRGSLNHHGTLSRTRMRMNSNAKNR